MIIREPARIAEWLYLDAGGVPLILGFLKSKGYKVKNEKLRNKNGQ